MYFKLSMILKSSSTILACKNTLYFSTIQGDRDYIYCLLYLHPFSPWWKDASRIDTNFQLCSLSCLAVASFLLFLCCSKTAKLVILFYRKAQSVTSCLHGHRDEVRHLETILLYWWCGLKWLASRRPSRLISYGLGWWSLEYGACFINIMTSIWIHLMACNRNSDWNGSRKVTQRTR